MIVLLLLLSFFVFIVRKNRLKIVCNIWMMNRMDFLYKTPDSTPLDASNFKAKGSAKPVISPRVTDGLNLGNVDGYGLLIIVAANLNSECCQMCRLGRANTSIGLTLPRTC